jgi:hypothetical protein
MFKNKSKTFLIVGLSLVGLIAIPILIVRAATSYRSNHSTLTSVQERYTDITNNSSYDYFVPNKTDTEWNAFLSKCSSGGLTNVACTNQCTRECTSSDPVGTFCGGGVKFAAGLVVSPGGCWGGGTSEPTCTGLDNNNPAWAYQTGYNESGATSSTDGLSNTNWLATNDPPVNPTANYCHDLVKNCHSDWYLPAVNQVQTLMGQYSMLSTKGIYGLGQYLSYWSSTQYSANTAYACDDGAGGVCGLMTYMKNESHNFRCIRSYP